MLLAAMFLAFLVQIVFRYGFNFRTGWASELTVITWLWLVLWGAAFVVRESEEIRFDLIYSGAGPGTRRAMTIAGAVAILVLYGMSLPAVVDYVTFMAVQSTAYLEDPFRLALLDLRDLRRCDPRPLRVDPVVGAARPHPRCPRPDHGGLGCVTPRH